MVVRATGSTLPQQRLTPQKFIEKWSASTLNEKSGAQQHFVDLCRMLDEPIPIDADPRGEWYCFERGVRKTGGGKGWADVWRRHRFAWEYKGPNKDLGAALEQLQRYALALENPPLLVVSDMKRIEIHTNFTNTVHHKYVIELPQLGSAENLKILKSVFTDPDELRPGKTKAAITEDAADRFASLAQVLRDRGGDPQRVAHFLNRILFCLFAQDAKLLPAKIVGQLLAAGVNRPDHVNRMLRSLFMAMKDGGVFGPHVIEWFNGGLFNSGDSVPLQSSDITELVSVADLDWSEIEPSIFGTLFERGLDPDKRGQIGAHYTYPESIMRIVEPVVVEPLAARWASAKHEIEGLLGKADKARGRSAVTKLRRRAQRIFDTFLYQLSEFRVLDPACGSGNFLYLALQALKDLEHRATLEAEHLGLEASFTGMHVGVQCLRGIEVNTYAAELARVTVWIGEIQWMLRHGVPPSKNPILKSLETIECRDAVLSTDGSEPRWQNADVIIGNPPFLGDKKMSSQLGKDYVSLLRKEYEGRVPGGADLVTYWFEKARQSIEANRARSAGLVATNSIRGGANRKILDRIRQTLTIFDAWSDQPWVNEGAAVRVSQVCFRRGECSLVRLNGKPVREIFPDLTGDIGGSGSIKPDIVDLTLAKPLPQNAGTSFSGIQKTGPFEIPGDVARAWLVLPNPHGRSNAEVVKPWSNGLDVTRRNRDMWIIDFGVSMAESEAALFEKPFEYVREHVKPTRVGKREARTNAMWWLFQWSRPVLRTAVASKERVIVTPEVAKHRVFAWLELPTVADKNLVVIARDDDVTFGILHSRFHKLWALGLCSWLGAGNDPRYTPTTTFETFPFPDGMAPKDTLKGPPNGRIADAIAAASCNLNELRDRWLNPPEWIERVPEVVTGFPDRRLARAGHDGNLRKRTLTNLYNEPPAWLENAHAALDHAVADAYGWSDYSPEISDDEVLSRLSKLNLARAPDLFTAMGTPAAAVSPPPDQSKQATVTTSRARDELPDQVVLDRRLAVVCSLVNRLADDPHFGRTKMAKLFYLTDVTGDLELETTYYREAAGPLDTIALYDGTIGLEALAITRGYITVEKTGRKITYRRGRSLRQALEDARGILGANRAAVNRLIDLFRRLDTDQCEIVATLYACWNDKLLDSQDATDESIVSEFLEQWHEKKTRFSKQRLLNALDWMREHRLIPTGRGAHTQMRQRKGLPRAA